MTPFYSGDGNIFLNKLSRRHFLCMPLNEYNILAILLSSLMFLAGCKKILDVSPPSNSISDVNVFTNDATAISVLTSIYSSMNEKSVGNPIQGNRSIALQTSLSGDELSLYDGVTDQNLEYYENRLQVNSAPGSGFNHWTPLYNYVFRCNAAIEGISSSSLTLTVKQQLLGEAKLMRAFFYFYLVNLYGDVPLSLTTDPEMNTLLSRSSKEIVYQQIITDLLEAENLLSEYFLNETLSGKTIERVRPTKWTASALLARVYLYIGDYLNAEKYSTSVINNNGLFSLPVLNKVFLKNSSEAIWQLQPTQTDLNTIEGQIIALPPTGPNTGNNPVFLSDILIKSFEIGDQRGVFGNWVDTVIYNLTSTTRDTVTYSYKYKINSSPGVTTAAGMSEYFMMFRLGEQYLIRAEARAMLNKISESRDDLNLIRVRAGLPISNENNQNSLLMQILHERQVELFNEAGHRWFDLKRTARIDEIMALVTPKKANGASWKPFQKLYPLPVAELAKAPNLEQNPGY
jgi:starch-binding outer membrane protein, SusD/RagB family